MGVHGIAGGLIIEGHTDLWRGDDGNLAVHDGHGVLPLGAGLVDAIFYNDTHGHPGGHGEKVGIDRAQHMVSGLLGGRDGLVDGGRAIDGAGALHQNGVGIAVSGQLKGIALHPASAVDGDGVAVSQAIHDLGGGLELPLSRSGVHRGNQQKDGQKQGRCAAGQGIGMSHGAGSFKHICAFKRTAPL